MDVHPFEQHDEIVDEIGRLEDRRIAVVPHRLDRELGRFLDHFLRLLRRAGRKQPRRARKPQRIACGTAQIVFELTDRIEAVSAAVQNCVHGLPICFARMLGRSRTKLG